MKKFLIISFVLVIVGCSREKNLTGEIFIVTQGGQNYKLGLVTVSLIAEDKMKSHLENKAKVASQNISPIYTEYKQLKDSICQLNIMSEELERKKQLLEIYDNNDEMLSVLRKRVSVISKKIAMLEKISPLEKVFLMYTSGSFFFDSLPNLIDSTKTDSDGRFNFVVQKENKYCIIASATRNIGDSNEKYYWIIKYPNSSFRENEKILLSNDNLFDPFEIIHLENNQIQNLSKL